MSGALPLPAHRVAADDPPSLPPAEPPDVGDDAPATPPDLQVRLRPVGPTDRGNVTLRGDVFNTGGRSQATHLSFLVQDVEPHEVERIEISSVEMGEYAPFEVNLSAPAPLTRLIVRVDADRLVQESNETNNEAYGIAFTIAETGTAGPSRPPSIPETRGTRHAVVYSDRGQRPANVTVTRSSSEESVDFHVNGTGNDTILLRIPYDQHPLGVAWSGFDNVTYAFVQEGHEAFYEVEVEPPFPRTVRLVAANHGLGTRVYGIGSTSGVLLEDRPMNMTQRRLGEDNISGLSIDFEDHDSTGQGVWYNKNWLLHHGISRPVFVHEDGAPLQAHETSSHWYVDPPHFSAIHTFDGQDGQGGTYQAFSLIEAASPSYVSQSSSQGAVAIHSDGRSTWDAVYGRPFLPFGEFRLEVSMTRPSGTWTHPENGFGLYPLALGNKQVLENQPPERIVPHEHSFGFAADDESVRPFYVGADGNVQWLGWRWTWDHSPNANPIRLQIDSNDGTSYFRLIDGGGNTDLYAWVPLENLNLTAVDTVYFASEGLGSSGVLHAYVEDFKYLPWEGNFANEAFDAPGAVSLTGDAQLGSDAVDLTSSAAASVGRVEWNDCSIQDVLVRFDYTQIGGALAAEGWVFQFFKEFSYEMAAGPRLGFEDDDDTTTVGHRGYGLEHDLRASDGEWRANELALLFNRADKHLARANWAVEPATTPEWSTIQIEVIGDSVMVYIDGVLTFRAYRDFDRTYCGFGISASTGGLTGATHTVQRVDNLLVSARPRPDGSLANRAPFAPGSPTPSNGSQAVKSRSADVGWYVADPDGQVPVATVYFGTDYPPTGVACANTVLRTCSLPDLVEDTLYYWRVEATDGLLNATSPIWTLWTHPAHQPPSTPANPKPTDGASSVPGDPKLSWDSADPEGAHLHSKVFVGTSNPPTAKNSCSWRDYLSCTLTGLSYSTTYYWQVVESDGEYESTGPVWQFTTKKNSPPFAPRSPSPADGTDDVFRVGELNWKGGDPDRRPVVYTVYFGSDAGSMTMLCETSATKCAYAGISKSQWHYWQVVASDGLASTAGPVWRFRTVDTDVPIPVLPIRNATVWPEECNMKDWGCTSDAYEQKCENYGDLICELYNDSGRSTPCTQDPGPGSDVAGSECRNWLVDYPRMSRWQTRVLLSWGENDPDTAEYRVYMSTSQQAVEENWVLFPPDPGPAAAGRVYTQWGPNAEANRGAVHAFEVCRTTSTSCHFHDPNPATTYYWRVVALENVVETRPGETPEDAVAGPMRSFTMAPTVSRATMPSPPQGASGRATSVALGWTWEEGESGSYGVTFGRDAPPEDVLCRGRISADSEPRCTVDGLEEGQTYYWQVISTYHDVAPHPNGERADWTWDHGCFLDDFDLDECQRGTTLVNATAGGASTQTREGPVWSFSTRMPLTPYVPKTPAPVGVNVDPVGVVLSWIGGGPSWMMWGEIREMEPVYRVYLDTVPVPQRMACDATMLMACGPLDLSFETTYYWKVEAHNGTTMAEGPVWTFTTGACSGNWCPTTVEKAWMDNYDHDPGLHPDDTQSLPSSEVGAEVPLPVSPEVAEEEIFGPASEEVGEEQPASGDCPAKTKRNKACTVIFLHGTFPDGDFIRSFKGPDEATYGDWDAIVAYFSQEEYEVIPLDFYGGACFAFNEDTQEYTTLTQTRAWQDRDGHEVWHAAGNNGKGHPTEKAGCLDGSSLVHDLNTEWRHIANHLAWWIYEEYSREGQYVDVVGHSMGGLMIQYALGHVAAAPTHCLEHNMCTPDYREYAESWPPRLLVENVASIAGPHGGSPFACLAYWNMAGDHNSHQLAQLYYRDGWRASAAMKEIRNGDFEAPQGDGGTYWLLMGSMADEAYDAVGPQSGCYRDESWSPWDTTAHRKFMYEGFGDGCSQNYRHLDFYQETDHSSGDACVRYAVMKEDGTVVHRSYDGLARSVNIAHFYSSYFRAPVEGT